MNLDAGSSRSLAADVGKVFSVEPRACSKTPSGFAAVSALSWSVHPARQRPRELLLIAAVLSMTTGAVLSGLHSVFLSALAAAILLLSVAPFLLPTRYRLSEWGVEESRIFCRRSRPWSELRRLEVGESAALVSPLARPSLLDRHRGITLRFSHDNRPHVVAALRAHLG